MQCLLYLPQVKPSTSFSGFQHYLAMSLLWPQCHIIFDHRAIFDSLCFSSPEFEKLDGSDMMRTCYLVNELFIQQGEQT